MRVLRIQLSRPGLLLGKTLRTQVKK